MLGTQAANRSGGPWQHTNQFASTTPYLLYMCTNHQCMPAWAMEEHRAIVRRMPCTEAARARPLSSLHVWATGLCCRLRRTDPLRPHVLWPPSHHIHARSPSDPLFDRVRMDSDWGTANAVCAPATLAARCTALCQRRDTVAESNITTDRICDETSSFFICNIREGFFIPITAWGNFHLNRITGRVDYT